MAGRGVPSVAARAAALSAGPGATPSEVALHRNFVESVRVLGRAAMRAAYYLVQIQARRIHRHFGFASILDYAAEVGGLAPGQTRALLELGRRLPQLPGIEAALACGDLTWHQARLLCRVARPEDEALWLEMARGLGLEALRARLAGAGRADAPEPGPLPRPPPGPEARADSRPSPAAPPEPADGHRCPPASAPPAVSATTAKRAAAPERADSGATDPATDGAPEPAAPGQVGLARHGALEREPGPASAPQYVSYRFTAEQYSRWEALSRAARHRGGVDKEETLLAALACLASGRAAHGRARPPYLVVLHECPACGRASFANARGAFVAPQPLLAAARCDGVVESPARNAGGQESAAPPRSPVARRGAACGPAAGGLAARRRATVPPRLRRAMLRRDGYRCQAPGCGSQAFLEVHHRVPVAAGGCTAAENLVTLCARCHRALHEQEESAREALRRAP